MSMENDTRLMMMQLRDRTRQNASAPVRRNNTIRRRGGAMASFALTLLTRLV